MRIDYQARKHWFARTVLIATAFLQFSCAAENEQEQPSVTAVASAAKSTAEQKAVAADGAEGQVNESASSTSAPYSVECGQVNEAGEPYCYVDRDTYIGWRTFHGFCHVCHAQDAVGSTFAPSLVERMRESDMTRDLFVERLNDGFTGQVGVMPAWKENPNVRKRYNELYAYLMARADGALPRGRPQKKPKAD